MSQATRELLRRAADHYRQALAIDRRLGSLAGQAT